MSKNILKGLLPQFSSIGDENIYIYNFLTEGWALLLSMHNIPDEKYRSEYKNLAELLDILLLSIDRDKLQACYGMLEAIKYYKMHRDSGERDIGIEYDLSDNFTFINIFYHAGVLKGDLCMYRDFLNHGAFSYSPVIDLIKHLQTFSINLKKESIIDLGSGNGLPVCLLAQIIDRVTGVEMDGNLYNESLRNINTLSLRQRLGSGSINMIQDDFFNIDFSAYSLIYICWPFDDETKKMHEEAMRVNLSIKIQAEAKKGTVIVVYIPGMEEKDIFPRLEKMAVEENAFSSRFHTYTVI